MPLLSTDTLEICNNFNQVNYVNDKLIIDHVTYLVMQYFMDYGFLFTYFYIGENRNVKLLS